MIRLQPYIDLHVPCPSCGKEVQPFDWYITGMHSMAEMTCDDCKKNFFIELPVNAGLFYPGIIDAETGLRCDDLPFENWYLSGLQAAYKNRSKKNIAVEVIRKKELGEKPVLILNTIDATYGHAVYELFNASYYIKKKEFDLVILVQKQLQWLVPEDAAQTWVVDLSFSNAVNWFDDLAATVKKLTQNSKDVFICRSFVQADSSDFNIEDYTKIKAFPLDEWDNRLSKPTITFIWRTDRFWKPVLPKVIDNRYVRKMSPGALNKLKNNLQFKWILRFSEKLREQLPSVDFAIAGMDDREPALPSWIKDFRYPKHDDDTAKLQAERYAASHLVVGCNGSSLLLPGCLSGGVINIVPGDMWSVSAGTFPFRITSIGDTHYRYAMLPAEISIDRLISVLIAVLRDRSYIQIQTSNPWRDHDSGLPPFAWAQFRKKISLTAENFGSTRGLISQPNSSVKRKSS